MTNRTITARKTTLTGKVAGVVFTDGTATADDTTATGKAAIEFAKRHGWAVSGGVAAAVDLTPADGEDIERWSTAELKAYLDDKRVQYPSGSTDPQLRAAIRDGFETKAEGGAAANQGAGHTSETIPPEGAGPVTNVDKPDDPVVAEEWVTPQIGNVSNDVAPTISVQPAATSKVEGATATYTVTAAGTPTPSHQWQRQAKGAGPWLNVGTDAASFTTPALTVAANNGDKYRVVLANTDGTLTSSVVTQAVTAS